MEKEQEKGRVMMRSIADYIFKVMTYLAVLSGVVYVFSYMGRVGESKIAQGISMFGMVMSILTVFYLMFEDTEIHKRNSGPIFLRVVKFLVFLYFILCWYFFVKVPFLQAFTLPV